MLHCYLETVSREWPDAGKHFIDHDPQGIDIGAITRSFSRFIQIILFGHQLFRRYILWCADDSGGRTSGRQHPTLLRDRDPEINTFVFVFSLSEERRVGNV